MNKPESKSLSLSGSLSLSLFLLNGELESVYSAEVAEDRLSVVSSPAETH